MNYSELAKINVNEHTEKKGNLTYLSWAWAVDQLQRLDTEANWTYSEPKVYGNTMMVFCTVTAFGRSRTAQLPVMDNRNKAITSPDAMQINTAMQRCLAKAIALHGLGLYIYAGEDLPEGYEPEKPQPDPEGKKKLEACASLSSLQTAWMGLTQAQRLTLADIKEACKAKISAIDRAAQKETA
jgi:hypothetical protein